MNADSLYRVYSDYLKNHYGQKVYKLPVNIPCSCPNRDGTKGYGGCIYCGESGSGYELLSEQKSVSEQLTQNRQLIEKKYKAKKFIAYFQSFSNTYLNFELFTKYMTEAAKYNNIIELAISTRPDCVTDGQLEFLKKLKDETGVEITIELGLQSANDKTLEILNRKHTVDDFLETAKRIKQAGLKLCTHVITDLPWDNLDDINHLAKVLNESGTDFLKIHSLYIEKNTKLAQMYNNGLSLLSSDAFIQRTIQLLEKINPNIVIERLIGRIPEENCLVANWQQSWWKIRDQLLEEMVENGSYQGKSFYGKR